jgi:threonine synthase
VTDDEILEACQLLATQEGVFCEPASAASYAGLLKMHRQGLDLKGRSAVCVITGTGLKDREIATTYSKTQPIEISADPSELETAVMALTS